MDKLIVEEFACNQVLCFNDPAFDSLTPGEEMKTMSVTCD